jgi:O-antigen ligase
VSELRPAAAGSRLLPPPPPPRAADALARGCEAGLAAAALAFLPLLVLAPRGAAPLVAFAGLCAAGLVLPARRHVAWPPLAAPAALFGGLGAWGAGAAAWAPLPWHSLALAARLVLLFAAALMLAAAADRITRPARLARLFVAGFVAAAALAGFDFAGGGMLTRLVSSRPYQAAWLNQAANAFAILVLPAAVCLAGRGRVRAALGFAAAGSATVFALAGAAPKVALAAGLAIGALAYLASTARIASGAAIVSVLLIVTAPLTFARFERLPLFPQFAERLKQSAEHRLLIWSFVGDRIAERPLSGWGLDASRAIPGGREPIRHGETWLPLHPHNAPLQLWLELGAPGAVLGALIASLLWRRLAAAAGWSHGYAAAAAGSLAAAETASLGTYGIWQEWWLGTLLLALFLVRVMARAAAPAEQGF